MAQSIVQFSQCKGPGGVVTVTVWADDVTGEVTQIDVKGEAGAKSNVNVAGVKSSAVFDGTTKSKAAPLGYTYDKANPKLSNLPAIRIDS